VDKLVDRRMELTLLGDIMMQKLLKKIPASKRHRGSGVVAESKDTFLGFIRTLLFFSRR